MTGKRLAEMMKGADNGFGPCQLQSVRVSAMTRAKETADIIASHLEDIPLVDPDPLVNEGR